MLYVLFVVLLYYCNRYGKFLLLVGFGIRKMSRKRKRDKLEDVLKNNVNKERFGTTCDLGQFYDLGHLESHKLVCQLPACFFMILTFQATFGVSPRQCKPFGRFQQDEPFLATDPIISK